MPAEVQNYQNHRKLVPLFHFVAAPLLLAAVALSAFGFFRAIGTPAMPAALGQLLLATAIMLLFPFIRLNALRVQDRVIALEVAERYTRLSGGRTFANHAERLTPAQIVALRFAGDAELVALADKALADGTAPDAIKQAIRDWRADHRRI